MPQAKNPFGSSARSARRPASRISARKDVKVAAVQPEDEKQRLIVAHAARHQAENDPTQVRLLWTGVIVTFVVVLGAWGYATLPRIFATARTPMIEIDMVQDSVQRAKLMQSDGEMDDVAKSLADISRRLDAVNTAATSTDVLRVLADQIEATSTHSAPTASRPELFQAMVTSSSSSSTSF